MSLAIKPNENEAFFREVDEELRREQMSGFWKRYGKLLVVVLVLFLAVVAGTIYWQHRQDVEAGQKGEALTALFADIQAGRTQGVAPKLDALAASARPAYRAAALLTKADLAVQSGDDAAAVAGYKAVAADGDLPQPYRDIALIRQTAVEFDALQPAAIIERLKPLAVAGNPWFGSAGELTALAHLRQNKPELAAPIFAAIAKDEASPESLRSRAVQMAGALGVDAVQAEQTGEATAATKDGSE